MQEMNCFLVWFLQHDCLTISPSPSPKHVALPFTTARSMKYLGMQNAGAATQPEQPRCLLCPGPAKNSQGAHGPKCQTARVVPRFATFCIVCSAQRRDELLPVLAALMAVCWYVPSLFWCRFKARAPSKHPAPFHLQQHSRSRHRALFFVWFLF